MSVRSCCTALSHAQSLPRTIARSQRRPFSLSPSPHSNNVGTSPPRPNLDNYTVNTTHIPPPKPDPSSPIASLASKLRVSGAAQPYTAYGTTEKLYLSCTAAGAYTLSASAAPASHPAHSVSASEPAALFKTAAGEDVCFPAGPGTWHGAYGLAPTFATWAQLAFVHMHVVQQRVRGFAEQQHARAWTQQLLDHFFYAAEEKMIALHGMGMKGVRARYLKDLFEQWRGAEVSYDQGVVAGDAVMAAAVWRNVFQARGDVDVQSVAEVVGWMRRAARGLGMLSDQEFMAAGWKFGVPWEGGELGRESEGIKRGFE